MADLDGRSEASGAAAARAIGALTRTHFLGFDFVEADYAALAAELDALSRGHSLTLAVTANVDHIVTLDHHADNDIAAAFRRAYAAAGVVTCDSRVLQALAWLRGVKLSVLTGADLTRFLFDEGWLDHRRVALIGGDEAMLAELTARYPAISLKQHIPPMAVLSDPTAIARIERFIEQGGFDYVLFAIGAPRSEIIAHRCMLTKQTGGVALAIGASIEFMLGRKPRAPRWMQQLRLEWAFRLMTEPRRLWRRYLVAGPRIFLIVSKWSKP